MLTRCLYTLVVSSVFLLIFINFPHILGFTFPSENSERVRFNVSPRRWCNPPPVNESITVQCKPPFPYNQTRNACTRPQPENTILRFRCKEARVPFWDWTVLRCGQQGRWTVLSKLAELDCSGFGPSHDSKALNKQTVDSDSGSEGAVRCPSLIGIQPKHHGVEIKCTQFSKITNCSEPQLVGMEVTYACKDFYLPNDLDTLASEQILTCGKDGNWSGLAHFEQYKCRPDCGRRIVDRKPLIVHGSVVANTSSWPWHGAIFRSAKRFPLPVYICGASLIAESVVITAAHCVSDNTGRQLSPEMFTVVLGTINSNFSLNVDSQQSKIFTVKRIFVHRNYNVRTLQLDVAILQLNEEATFSDFVSPICIPDTYAMDVFAVETGKRGDVVGFGVDESGKVSSELRHLSLPVASLEDCYKYLNQRLLDSQFCAGNRKTGQAVCNGDSGGGMAFPNEVRSAYYLHGIVSSGDPTLTKGSCQNLAVFSRIYRCLEWIAEKLEVILGERRLTSSNRKFTYEVKGTELKYAPFTGGPRDKRMSGLRLEYVQLSPEVLLRTLENVRDIETIELLSVELDSPAIFKRRLRLPLLQSFVLDWVNWELQHSLDYLTKESVQAWLFFDKDEEWEFEKIVHLNTDILLRIGIQNIIMVKHNVSVGGEIASSLKESSAILRNLPPEFNLRQLSLLNIPLTLDSIPANLTYLHLRNVRLTPGEFNVSLSSKQLFSQLEDLIFLDSLNYLLAEVLNYHFPPKLKRLVIDSKLTLSSEMELTAPNLVTLVIRPSNQNQFVLGNLNRIFPNVKEIMFLGLKSLTSGILASAFQGKRVERIWVNSLEHPRFDDKRNSDSSTYFENLLNGTGLPINVENYIHAVFEKNFKGQWKAKVINKFEFGLIRHALQDAEKLYSSREDYLSSERLATHEKLIFQKPEEYKICGEEDELYIFRGIPDYLSTELEKVEICYAQAPGDKLITSLAYLPHLQSINLTKVKLVGEFFEHFEAKLLKDFKLDRTEPTLIHNRNLAVLLPFYTDFEPWLTREILLLGSRTRIDLRLDGNQIFYVDPTTGTLLMSEISGVLEKHQEFLKSSPEAPLCSLYENVNGSNATPCNREEQGPGYQLDIKHLTFLGHFSRTENADVIPSNLTSLKFGSARFHQTDGLNQIILRSPFLEKVDIVSNPYWDNRLSLDISSIPSTGLKILRLYDVELTDSFGRANQEFSGRSLDKLILDRMTYPANMDIFQVFPAKEVLLFLRHGQISILEKAVSMGPDIKIKLVILIKLKKNGGNLYSEELTRFFKELNVYHPDQNYHLFLENRVNGSWVALEAAFKDSEFNKDPHELFPSRYPNGPN